MEVLFVLLFTFAHANAYVIETIGRPTVTVLDCLMETCGLAPVLDCGCRTIEPSCGCAPVIDYGYRTIEPSCGCAPVIDYGYRTIEPSCGCAPVIDYGYRTIEPSCGCAPVIDYGYRTIEPSCGCAPVIDCAYGYSIIEPPCGCAPVIDYEYRTIGSPCGCASIIDNCGCRVLERGYPVLNKCDSICQGPFSPILDTGLAFSYVDALGCGLRCPCSATIPPLPPMIGCPKYLRQITVPPPFL